MGLRGWWLKGSGRTAVPTLEGYPQRLLDTSTAISTAVRYVTPFWLAFFYYANALPVSSPV